MKDTPSRTAWDEDDEERSTPGKVSSWDRETPSIDGGRQDDFSHRSSRSSRSESSSRSSRSSSRSGGRSSSSSSSGRPHYERLKETPLPTPTYKKNPWHNRRREGGGESRRGGEKSARTPMPGNDTVEYEEEAKRLDR